MSSNFDLGNANTIQICRVCLATNDNMYKMNNSDIFAFRNIVPSTSFKIFSYSDMFLCQYCRHLLLKVLRFTQQCLKAEEVLSNMNQQDLKPHPSLFHNFSTTTTTHQFPEEPPDDGDDHGGDYDDIPLVMLKEEAETWQEPEVKKKRKRRVKKEKIEDASESPTNKTSTSQKKKEKRQKVLKEGFTSRMVQETNEYIVIKLTKEQVLEELSLAKQGERYRRSPYKCERCARGYNFLDVLQNHLQRHSPEAGPLQCEICSQYCPTAVSMRGHMKSHTTRYECKACGIRRGSRQHLLEHFAIQHGHQTRTYRCAHCDYATNKRTVMQRHSRSHSTTDKLACHLCGELFKDLTTLRVHTVRHDKSRQYRCAQCPRTFVTPGSLHSHFKAHRDDHYCVECDVRFKSQDNLRLHFKKAKRHRDASSYKHECPLCSQRFVTSSALAGHQSSAHGVPKKYSCASCGRAYSSRSSLRAHTNNAHAHESRTDTCKGEVFPLDRPPAPLSADHRQEKEDSGFISGITQPVPNEG